MRTSGSSKKAKNTSKKDTLPRVYKRKGNLRKFFGIHPADIDGPEFQKKVMAEWD